MQERQLKLKEIIWEITAFCSNNCSYCGSKSERNKVSNENILKIAEEIAKYPPEAIDISGGDPLTIDFEIHKKILEILKDVKSKKIIVNPKSLIPLTMNILNLYDWIGISINTKEEMRKFIKIIEIYKTCNIFSKVTIITNFNMENIFIFDKIESFVKEKNYRWQLQYTQDKYNEKNNVFNNEEAYTFLSEKVGNSTADVVLADNMNDGCCGAGVQSLGILYNGIVVPCLSMRSWKNEADLESEYQGTLLGEGKNSLESIWNNMFHKYRFCSFECCKDFCKNKIIKIKNISDLELKLDVDEYLEWMKNFKKQNNPIVTLYGVNPRETGEKPIKWPGISVYAVSSPNVMAYAVNQASNISVFNGINNSTSVKEWKIDCTDIKNYNNIDYTSEKESVVEPLYSVSIKKDKEEENK